MGKNYEIDREMKDEFIASYFIFEDFIPVNLPHCTPHIRAFTVSSACLTGCSLLQQ